MGRLRRVPGWPERDNRILEPVTEPPPAVFDACGARALSGHTTDVAQDPYPFYPSLAALNTLVWRVVYNSPILIEAFFARPWRSARHSAWSSSDQIGGTEATRDPRRPKGLVMVTQGHGEHPAAASRRRTLGKKFTTTKLCLVC